MHRAKILLLIAVLFGSLSANAKLFRNSYLSFELPPNWKCQMEGTEWVCVSQYSQRAKEAIIILTAKELGPSDNIPAYLAHLRKPKNLRAKNGTTTPSKVLHVRQRTINNQVWIDGMHLGSEVKNYYTRYLASIKDRIAVLVTFSAHKQHYTKYSNDFLKAIQSLRVVASKNLLAQRSNNLRPSNETIGAPIGSAIPTDMMSEEFPDEISNDSNSETIVNLLAIALIFAALGIYLIIKRRKS